MPEAQEKLLRSIPQIDTLLQSPELSACTAGVPRRVALAAVREAVAEVRDILLAEHHGCASEEHVRETILAKAQQKMRAAMGPHYRKAVNATGIILHTGLGRAVLPKRAIEQIQKELAGYSVLQVDAETGQRSRRDERLQWLLGQLTGAEAATVVNNNAAATMIVLNTLAQGKEVIVSRGQLVEIGGSFRLPEVMAASGAHLVEVGTTNKTHLRDYERAITPDTAAIMRVHPSNYKIYGFTSEVPLADLVALAHSRNISVIDDVGAGALLDFSQFGFPDEPLLADSIKAGADVTTSSADKLIGASQGGIILGRRELIERIRKSPLARILRVGKLTLAALEATLTLFLDEAAALREVPTLAMLMRRPEELGRQAQRLAAELERAGVAASVAVVAGASQMGSGSLPTRDIPTHLVAVAPQEISADALARRLRQNEPPVFARIQDERLLVDPRTLLEGDEQIVVQALLAALRRE